jgi:hypothetical protein
MSITWQEQVEKTAHKTRRGDDKKFKEWMLSKESLTYCFDYYLWAHCYSNYLALQNNYDNFWVVCGGERQGKTTIAAQLCAVISPTFRKENICYTMEDIVMQARNSQKGDSILIDEGAIVLFSRDSASKSNKDLNKLFTVFGMKNLNVVICIPNFFMLDTYIREHRVKTLIAVTERSKYHAFVKGAIPKISKDGYKNKKVVGIRIPEGTHWRGYFNKGFPVINDLNETEYEKWKEHNINKMMDKIIEGEKPEKYITTGQAAKELGLSIKTIRRRAKEGEFKTILSKNSQGRIKIEKESFELWKDNHMMHKKSELV